MYDKIFPFGFLGCIAIKHDRSTYVTYKQEVHVQLCGVALCTTVPAWLPQKLQELLKMGDFMFTGFIECHLNFYRVNLCSTHVDHKHTKVFLFKCLA